MWIKFVLVCSCFIAFLAAEIVVAEKVAEQNSLWGSLNEECLVVFDVDDVIVSTDDHFGHPYGFLKFMELTERALEKCKTSEEKNRVTHKIGSSLLLAKWHLVEKTMPQFIRTLQGSGIKVVALTHFPRGEYGPVSRTEAWRIEQLKRFGIDFSLSFPQEENHEFTEIADNGSVPPFYEKGILFSNGYSKGEVLEAFFHKSNFYPSKVVFIDDLLHNHHSVEKAMKHLQIPFIGIHYTGASKKFGTCNEELLQFQLNHLLQTSTWLSDQEILHLWQNGLDLWRDGQKQFE